MTTYHVIEKVAQQHKQSTRESQETVDPKAGLYTATTEWHKREASDQTYSLAWPNKGNTIFLKIVLDESPFPYWK